MKCPHLNNFLGILAEPGMEGAEHLILGRPLKVRVVYDKWEREG
jgi:hypothetical protein